MGETAAAQAMAAPPPAPAAKPAGDALVTRLETPARLRHTGALSGEEFQAAKGRPFRAGGFRAGGRARLVDRRRGDGRLQRPTTGGTPAIVAYARASGTSTAHTVSPATRSARSHERR
jgi:hypothetical protein